MTAVEMTGLVDENYQLHLDKVLPVAGPVKVRVIVLYPVKDEEDNRQWGRLAAKNPVFDFQSDEAEDIYTSIDGFPVDEI